MNEKEAIERIRDHMEVHRIGEYPHIKLAEALNMAIDALHAQQTPVKLDRIRWGGVLLVYRILPGSDRGSTLGL